MSKIRNVDEHVGGDFGLFTQNGEHCENFSTVEGAIENAVASWQEHCGEPQALTIRDPNNVLVATICPIGSDALKVVRSNGDTMDWTEIHYILEDGRYLYTSARNNGIEYKFKF